MSGTKVKSSELIGRRIEFPDGRFVFVGAHHDFPADTGLVFRNAEGHYLSFRLSPSATDALKELLANPESGIPGAPPPPPAPEITLTWAVVE